MRYNLLSMLFFLLFVSVNARTIYKVYETGQCLDPAAPITDQSTCEKQSESIGWPDHSATPVSFSSYLPTGCILQASSNDVVPNITLRLVQPNIQQSKKWDPENIENNLNKLLALSTTSRTEQINYIIWPETAVTYFLEYQQEILMRLKQIF